MDRQVPDIPGEPVSDEVGNYLKMKVSQILHTRFNQFPGSQPVSFARNNIQDLENTDYLACEKSDGLRVLMLVLINQDTGEEGTFLINRENDYYMVPGFHFPRSPRNFDSSHNGTILDGELVYSTNPQTGIREVRYLIFDCLAMDMVSVMHKNLYKRLYHAQHEFHRPYIELRRAFPEACARFPFKIDFKNMTQPFKIDKIFKEMKNLTYKSDGLVLTCCDSPYSPGTDPTLLKWKPAEDNTIDFKIQLQFPVFVDTTLSRSDPHRAYPNYDEKPAFKLFVWKGGKDPNESEAVSENCARHGGEYKNSFATYEDWHVQLNVSDNDWEEMKATGESFNGRIAECYHTKDGKWHMLRWRDDKMHGNHVSVVLRILKSIEDGVTKEELIAAEPEIKRRWGEREKAKRMAPRPEAQRQAPPPAHNPHPAQPPPQKRQLEEEMPHYTESKASSDEYESTDGFEEAPKFANKRQEI